MIKRIVKMTFQEDKTNLFVDEVFEQSKARIRAFEGCRYMELLRDKTTPNILFTVSIWESEQALEHYRASELFAQTWSKTKALFAGKPEAWSLTVLDAPPGEGA